MAPLSFIVESMSNYKNAAAVQEAVASAPKGTHVEVAQYRSMKIVAAPNGFKQGFSLSLLHPKEGVVNVTGCVNAKTASLDGMLNKVRTYADKYGMA